MTAEPPTGGAPTPLDPEVDGGQVHPPEPVVATMEQAVAGLSTAPPAVANRIVANRIVGWATDMGTPTTLVLLRHGETAGSVAKLFSGRGGHDHELTPLGRTQARLAGQLLAATRHGIGAIVASPLRRCLETAAYAAEELGLEISIEEGFAESAFGEWDGLTYEQVAERWPGLLRDWLNSTSVAPPGGESMEALESRVLAARDRVISAHLGATVLVVAHVNPIKSLVRVALDAPPHAVYRMAMAPASVSEIDYYPDGTGVLRGFGLSAHTATAASAPGR